jgi:hypothetical protein
MLTFSYHFLSPNARRRPISGLGAVLLSHLVSMLSKPSSPVLDSETNFCGCGLCSCNLLAKTNKSGFSAGLLLCFVYEQQKTFSPGLKLRTVFWGNGLYFHNFLFGGKNNFSLSTYLLLFLDSELQKPSSLGLKPRTVIQGCGLYHRNHLHWESNQRQLSALVAFTPVLTSSKQTTLVLALLFYLSQFPNYRNRPQWDLNSGQFVQSSDLSKSSSWSQRISMPSLVQIRVFVFEL